MSENLPNSELIPFSNDEQGLAKYFNKKE